ncbi:hypothetical protein ACIBEK_08135 [Nocardia fusca]|uniref:hypothetical protein n=1 Tax=Nocardia fusca TaxID=941183 RepID=UPI0037B7FC6F
MALSEPRWFSILKWLVRDVYHDSFGHEHEKRGIMKLPFPAVVRSVIGALDGELVGRATELIPLNRETVARGFEALRALPVSVAWSGPSRVRVLMCPLLDGASATLECTRFNVDPGR